MILHKDTREALDINLTDNIVIFDEAHNLIETINNIYSIEIDVLKVIHPSIRSRDWFSFLDISSTRTIDAIFGTLFEAIESQEHFLHWKAVVHSESVLEVLRAQKEYERVEY